jgi:4-amino-4-deoxy-L-arabinose transferase-like glycosyltransferase
MFNSLLKDKLAVVVVIAVVVRLGVLIAFPSIFAFDQTGSILGSGAYDTYAQNLLKTGVYGAHPGSPDAIIPPLYSLALAGVYGMFGRGALQVGLFHILLDALSISLLYHSGRRLFAQSNGDMIGALAGLFYALYPYLIFQNLTLNDTAFFMALLYAFIWLLIVLREREHLDRGTWIVSALAGLILGLTLLTRAIVPPLALLAAIWFLFRLNLKQTILRLLPVAVIGVAVVIPWMLRNYSVYGVWIPMSLNSGENFYQGNSIYTIPYFRAGYDVQWVPIPELKAADLYSPAANAERAELGMAYLRAHPEQILDLIWTKLLVHWSIDVAPRQNPTEGKVPRLDYQGNALPETDSSGNLSLGQLPQGDPVNAYSQPLFDQIGRVVHRFYWGALFLLGLMGLLVTARQWRSVSLLWFAQISMTAVYVFFHPSTRYRVPTDPLWFLFSAAALIWLWAWWQYRLKK